MLLGARLHAGVVRRGNEKRSRRPTHEVGKKTLAETGGILDVSSTEYVWPGRHKRRLTTDFRGRAPRSNEPNDSVKGADQR